jgi:hypothetical protein
MTPTVEATPDFVTAEGLRLLLVRLRYSGTAGWRDDPEASALMSYTMDKYGALARRHGYEPAEAASAAFDAMRTRAVRVAEDPWAVVTHAVELTLIYEQRAEGLLCSNHQARRESEVDRHDAMRFSDRENELADIHPAFAIAAPQDAVGDADEEEPDEADEPTNAYFALDDAVTVFVALRWPEDLTRMAIEYICSRLMRSGNRATAFEALRRDRHPWAMLDVGQEEWLVFLRVILGNQHPDRLHTSAGRGMLLRLVIGDQPEDLLDDRSLVADIASIPHPKPRKHAEGTHV